MRSRIAETEIACRWIEGAPAGTRWHVIGLAIAGDDLRATVYAARIALRNALDVQRRERRAWRAVDIRAWVVDLAPLSGRVYGRVVGLIASVDTDIDPPAIADMLARSRTWRGGIEVTGPLTASEARNAMAEMIGAWSTSACLDAGSRRIIVGPRTTRARSPVIRAHARHVMDREPMPWIM